MDPLCTIVGMGPGVSQSVAKRFSAAGYRIAMVARNQAKLDEYSTENMRGFAADSGNEDSLAAAFTQIQQTMGDTEVLFYNASSSHGGSPTTLSVSDLLSDFRVNVVGAVISVQRVVEAMKRAGKGTILLTGGGLALDPWPPVSSLAIGKAGIRSLAFSLAKELEPAGIHVATVTICGFVKEGTTFDPAYIAESFYKLHGQPAGQWDREITFR